MRILRDSGLVLLLLGLLVHILSVASPYWEEGGQGRAGLWLVCGEQSCEPFVSVAAQQSGFMHAVQGLCLGGALLALVAVLAIVWYFWKKRMTSYMRFSYLPGVLTLVAGFMTGLGLLIYVVEVAPEGSVLGWTMYMDCGAFGILLVSATLQLSAAYKEWKDTELDRLEHYFSSKLEFNLTDWSPTHL